MDRRTLEVYERLAVRYQQNRPPAHEDRARRLAGAASPGGPLVDLGCGPGGYGPALATFGHPVVGIDASAAMLALATGRVEAVRADLRDLPVRRRSLAGAWARNSYLHLRREELASALAQLHHGLAVGSPLCLSLLRGEDFVSTDDLPGRTFHGWEPEALADVLEGAGFGEIEIEAGGDTLWATARRQRTLPDFVGPGMRLLVCGLNPSLTAADAGYGFAGATNRFWTAARAAGLIGATRDPWRALRQDGVGMTDLVKRATPRAAEVAPDEYRRGAERIERMVARLAPGAVCFVGLEGWRAARGRRAGPGWQEGGIGGRPAYVMPSTSGLNARTSLVELVGHLSRAGDGPPGAGR